MQRESLHISLLQSAALEAPETGWFVGSHRRRFCCRRLEAACLGGTSSCMGREENYVYAHKRTRHFINYYCTSFQCIVMPSPCWSTSVARLRAVSPKWWRWSSIVVAPSSHQLALQPAQRCTLHVVLLPPRSIRVHRVACQLHIHLATQWKARFTGGMGTACCGNLPRSHLCKIVVT